MVAVLARKHALRVLGARQWGAVDGERRVVCEEGVEGVVEVGLGGGFEEGSESVFGPGGEGELQRHWLLVMWRCGDGRWGGMGCVVGVWGDLYLMCV